MYDFIEKPDVFNKAILLASEEIKFPGQVIKKFFQDYTLSELRQYLWDQVEVCLSTDNVAFSEPDKRGDLIYRHKRIEMLMEALCLLY